MTALTYLGAAVVIYTLSTVIQAIESLGGIAIFGGLLFFGFLLIYWERRQN